MKIRKGASLKDVTGAAAYGGGALVQVRRIAHFDGSAVNTVKTFVDDLLASASPDALEGDRVGSGVAVSNATTVTPSGGAGPFTYAWSRLSGSGAIESPTKAKTTFSQFVSQGSTSSGVFQCTVTDASGETVAVQVAVSFSSVSDL